MHKDSNYLSLQTLIGRWQIPMQQILLHAVDGTIRLSTTAKALDLPSEVLSADANGWVQLTVSDIQASLTRDGVRVSTVYSGQKEIHLQKSVEWVDIFVSKQHQVAFERAVNFLPDSSPLDLILQTDHANHSTELAAAVRAWNAVCKDPQEDNDPFTIKKRVRKWTNNNYPGQFNETQTNRIGTVANPDHHKKGGLRRTPRN